MAECNNYTGLQINPTPSSIGNQYAGVSTDEKPANAPTYSVYLELDTGKFYYYDGTEWKEVPCCGDAGGGGGSIATAKVTLIDQKENGSGYTVLLTFIPEGGTAPLVNVSHDSPVTVQFPLYHGAYILPLENFSGNFDFSIRPTALGGVKMTEGEFEITGDGSIFISSGSAGASGSAGGSGTSA